MSVFQYRGPNSDRKYFLPFYFSQLIYSSDIVCKKDIGNFVDR
jgi:hypothetical protein